MTRSHLPKIYYFTFALPMNKLLIYLSTIDINLTLDTDSLATT